MNFTILDWSAIVGYLAITLFLGLYFRSRSGKSVDDYFVSGRNVSWWLAGTSMVATTFAADTPLVVTGLVYTQGIAGNWLWWAFLLSGMMTVFLFARLWRRSGLLTDVQFAEMRYSGKPAAFLRGFRALYLGLLMNCLILGWVTKAMTSIVAITFGDDRPERASGLRVFSYSIHRTLRCARRPMGRPVDRSLSVRVENGHRHWGRVVCRRGRRRHVHHCSRNSRRCGLRPVQAQAMPLHSSRISRGLSRPRTLWALPVLTFLVNHRSAVVGILVSRRGTRRRRLHRAAHLQRKR